MTSVPHHKITSEHLARKAVVYLRQSTPQQVRRNRESQHLQYAMAERARKLGWHTVQVIDTDLGNSASVGTARREGFEEVMASVAVGEVGIVLSREVSRLSRTDRDWCRLLEVCQVFGTLIGDEGHVYDLSNLDDQLVLGIKGTLSVVELKILRMRMVQGQEEKARRGQMLKRVPVGYQKTDVSGSVVLDPDRRIRDAVARIFQKFREVRTVRQTFQWFRDHDIELPANRAQGPGITWRAPTQSFVRDVLANPFYAGAYVWGRRPMETVVVDGKVHKRQGRPRRAEECRVFLPDHHEGYISWDTYQENQRMIRRNSLNLKADESVGPSRAGRGLLAGLLRCGRCGRKLHIRYWGRSGKAGRYLCKGDYDAGGEYCLGFGGAMVDRLFSQKLLQVISPLGAEASLQAIDELSTSGNAELQSLRDQREQLEYEARRAFEQYNAVDARNRLVASDLETRWNTKLEQLKITKARIADLEQTAPRLTSDDEERIRYLGKHFEELWNTDSISPVLRKEIIRAAIEEIVVNLNIETNTLKFVVHWKGGAHTEITMKKAEPGNAQRTSMESLDIIGAMAERYGDDQIASVLNRLGHRTGKDMRWTQTRVATARRNHKIEGQKRAKPNPDVLTLNQAARYLRVSHMTIRRLKEAGALEVRQVAPRAPWEIQRSDLDAESIRQIVEHLHRTGRLVIQGGSAVEQESLFTENKGVDNARHHA